MATTTTYTALGILEAINLMLATIGSSPISSLEGGNDLHTSMAQNFLHEASREVQSIGYHFNYEEDYPLPLGSSGEVNVPGNTLRLEVTNTFDKVVMRGTRLYNLTTHSYTFVSSVPFKADVTLFLPWLETPQPFRQYVAILAARRFQRRVQGDQLTESLTAIEESMAKTILEDYEASTSNFNLKDNYETFDMLSRW